VFSCMPKVPQIAIYSFAHFPKVRRINCSPHLGDAKGNLATLLQVIDE
jgi:hypothetical protein